MLPTIFVGHGGGPMPLLGHPSHEGLVRSWAPGGRVHTVLHDTSVKAVVVISAHHESRDGAVVVMTDPKPGLLFDYSGFPPEAYHYTMPNPGSPEVAMRVLDLLSGAGVPARGQAGRGHDHGVFVPWLGLGLASERPTLPVVSVSLRGPADHRPGLTEDHLAMGKALAPLRSQGVLVLGSGNTIHARCSQAQAKTYDDYLQGLAAEGPLAFAQWANHPMASVCSGRPDHLAPLLVCAGAAVGGTVESIQHTCMGYASSHFLFHAAT